jgi:hypothetical protein
MGRKKKRRHEPWLVIHTSLDALFMAYPKRHDLSPRAQGPLVFTRVTIRLSPRRINASLIIQPKQINARIAIARASRVTGEPTSAEEEMDVLRDVNNLFEEKGDGKHPNTP